MSDWNEQAAPNNNLSSATIRKSKLVGEEGLQKRETANEVSNVLAPDNKDLTEHLLSRQPGM
jgi:hypothetical protein